MSNKCTLLMVIVLLLAMGMAAFADETAAPRQVPLPDLGPLSAEFDAKALQGKPALICFWDYTQRPSRRFVKQLVTLRDKLDHLDLPVLLIQMDLDSSESSRQWLDSQPIDWPSETLTTDVETCFREWSISGLPWPVFTDANQIQSMGFTFDQLAAVVEARDLSDLPLHVNWRFTFESLYYLKEGEILKRIAPSAVRTKYYQMKHPDDSYLPDVMVFHWDKTLQLWGESMGSPGNLRLALSFVLGLKSYEYEISEDLLATTLPGDWVLRKEISVEEKLSALTPILSESLQRPISFVRRNVERESVVVTGEFNLDPLDEAGRRSSVYLYTDPNDDRSRGGGGGFDSVAQLLGVIGDRIGMPIVDQAVPCDNLNLGYSTLRSSYLRRVTDPVEKRKKSDSCWIM